MASNGQVCCNGYLSDIDGGDCDPLGHFRPKGNRQTVQTHFPEDQSACQQHHSHAALQLKPVAYAVVVSQQHVQGRTEFLAQEGLQ